MRRFILVAGALACLSLTACEGQVSQAEATPAPPPKKSLARPAPMYAGQEQVLSVQSGAVEVGHSGGLNLSAKATASSAGWTAPAFLPRIYAAQPPDGIYEVDVIATAPSASGAQGGQGAATPIDVSGHWNRYTDGRVKGIRFLSKTNEVTVMVPPAG
ncbi:hypothetical protein ACO2Q0_12400 [Phenylobacterium sp. VNQ135]|uniref:hypothetical protein n=1 Tax=Phenylobacterium sp. VNQ135 TaxID=3400922 RepID=UPI003C0827F9